MSNTFTKILFKYNIFIQALSGYDIPEKIVLKIDRSLYSLKQTARDWYNIYLKILINNLRFQRFSINLCVFTIYTRRLIVGLYINNLIIVAKKFKNVL